MRYTVGRWMHKFSLVTSLLSLSLSLFSSAISAEEHSVISSTSARATSETTRPSGLRFSCSPTQLKKVEKEMTKLFQDLKIPTNLFVKKGNPESGHLLYTLNTPETDTTTFDFHKRPEYKLKDDKILMHYGEGDDRETEVVSKKEILLAFLQHGRLTEFKDDDCSVDILKDQIGIRQNIAAWTENTYWNWPGDNKPDATDWNYDLWTRAGTPKAGVPVHKAFADVFTNPKKYAPYCYTASKLAVVHGILDYYKNVKKDPQMLAELERRLMLDGDPLVDVDPDLDVDNAYRVGTPDPVKDAQRITRNGKLVGATFNVAPNNFIPGDWAYFLNTDVRSANIRGYEGSNSIYMGRDKFDDYYYEHEGAYSKKEKLDEIYLWKWEGIEPKPRITITDAMRESMNRTPEQGGVVENFRWIPFNYGGNPLPKFKNR